MTAKEYLEQIGKLKGRIESLKRLAERYDELSLAIPGQDFTRERVQTTPSHEAPFVKWIYKKVETEEQVKELQAELERLKIEVAERIETLQNNDYKNILYMRYFNGFSFYDISNKIYVSISTVKRWHNEALDSMKME